MCVNRDSRKESLPIKSVAFFVAALLLVAAFNYAIATVPLPPTVQMIEVLWCEFSVIGISYQSFSLFDAILDAHALGLSGRNGARKIISRNGVRNQASAVAMHAMFLSIGIAAMTQAPTHQQLTVTSAMITVALLGANAALVANAVFNRRARLQVEQYFAAQETERGEKEGVGV